MTRIFRPFTLQHMPPEVLKKILGFLLCPAKEEFLSIKYDQLWRLGKMRRKDVPASSALLVCKCWLHIGRPLLYESVKLCSVDHVRTLRTFLSSHPSIQRWIRHLRLEGGLGLDLFYVFQCIPKLRSLYLAIKPSSRDSIAGLCRALPSIRPSELYLAWEAVTKPRNQKSMKLQLAIVQFIKECPSLTRMASSKYINMSAKRDFGIHFAEALSTSSSLRELSLPGDEVLAAVEDGTLEPILQSSRLNLIHCRCSNREDMERFASLQIELPEKPKLRVLWERRKAM